MVSVGTHEQPFQRLLDAVARAVSDDTGDLWVVQYGVGRWTVRDERVVAAADYCAAPDMQQHLRWADVLVSQASPGNVYGALAADTWPIVAGRRAAHREHVDDHQVRFAAELDRSGRATDLGDPSALSAALRCEDRRGAEDRLARVRRAARTMSANERRFRDDVWRLLADLV